MMRWIGLCLGWILGGWSCSEASTCQPQCLGRVCGDDSCGGQCGSCLEPPASACGAGDVLLVYQPAGQCQAGQCVFTFETQACAFGCEDGVCRPDPCLGVDCSGPPPPCRQGPGQCRAEGAVASCFFSPVADGTACPDSLYCNGMEACQAGICQAAAPVECPAPTGMCRQNACDEASASCLETVLANGTGCEDGNPCTLADVCIDGTCQSGEQSCPPVALLFYWAGDNDLDAWMVEDVEELEAANPDQADWLRVFVLLDRSASSSDPATRLYEIHASDREELDASHLGLVAGQAVELNTGDPAVLRAFILDVTERVGPGVDRYLLLGDHGDGWWKKTPAPSGPRGCCYDDTSAGDYLSSHEIHQAVAGQHLVLLGFDACMSGMAEVAYEHRDDARWLVASPETEGLWGWDLQNLVSQFAQGPDRSAERFAHLAVDTYMLSSLSHLDFTATMAVYDLTQIPALALAAGEVAQALSDLEPATFEALCAGLDWYGCDSSGCEEHTDLYHLAQQAAQLDATQADVYQALMDQVEAVVVYEAHSFLHPACHGLAVYFPCEYYPYSDYGQNSWAQATGWIDMLNSF